jgi:DNA-binding MarR family transcriptional regulator
MEMIDRNELQFTEAMGRVFELSGASRMAGRVWGYLLIADAEHVSASSLADALETSPSSISSATRLLIGLGMIDRVRVPGERRDYFTIHHGAVMNLLRRRMEAIAALEDLAQRGLAVFGERPVARPHLEELVEVYSWFGREISDLIHRFEAGRAAAPAKE